MSAVASGFSILFLFWSITHFARKIVLRPTGGASGTPAGTASLASPDPQQLSPS